MAFAVGPPEGGRHVRHGSKKQYRGLSRGVSDDDASEQGRQAHGSAAEEEAHAQQEDAVGPDARQAPGRRDSRRRQQDANLHLPIRTLRERLAADWSPPGDCAIARSEAVVAVTSLPGPPEGGCTYDGDPKNGIGL